MKDVAPLTPKVKCVGDGCEQDADKGHDCGPVELRRLGEGHRYNISEVSHSQLCDRLEGRVVVHLIRSATFCIEYCRAVLQSGNRYTRNNRIDQYHRQGISPRMTCKGFL
jgi:hypothetical protein